MIYPAWKSVGRRCLRRLMLELDITLGYGQRMRARQWWNGERESFSVRVKPLLGRRRSKTSKPYNGIRLQESSLLAALSWPAQFRRLDIRSVAACRHDNPHRLSYQNARARSD